MAKKVQTSSTNARVGKSYSVISDVTVAPFRFSTQDINTWKQAIESARNPTNPRRRPLYELYENILIDGKVLTVREKRKIGITNKDFVFYKKGTKREAVERIQEEVIDSQWFSDLLEFCCERKFWGHSLMEIVPGSETPIDRIELIPQMNVVPERGELLLNYMDTRGIPYRGEMADEFYKKHLIEFGKPKDLGLLLSIAQYVIYKRGGYGDWAQFAELFGMPFRIGKYDPFDDSTRQKLLTALAEMGGAGYAVIPEGSSIDFKTDNTGTGRSDIFQNLIKQCNDEIAQIVLGGTMTTEDGASRSQSETHKDGENDINKADIKDILRFLNGPFKKRLVMFGYSEAEHGKFTVPYNEVISMKDRILIDEKVAEQVEVDEEYWYDTYGVKAPKGGPKAKAKPNGKPVAETEEEEDNEPQKKKEKQSLSLLYGKACAHCNTQNIQLRLLDESEIEKMARRIFEGKHKKGTLDKNHILKTANKLMDGINAGYITNPGDSSYSVKDEEMLAMLQGNVFVFSGFKNHAMLKAVSALLVDEKGNVREWAEFKDKVLQLDREYNITYLNVEYNHAVASSQMASKWISFQNLKEEFPNLTYRTAGDDRVRQTHAAKDGVTKPLDDIWWNTNYPPNDWGCRCDVDATNEGVTPGKLSDIKKPDMFRNNVGKDGVVFPSSHPYFEASKAEAKKITSFAKSLIPKK